MNKEEEGVVWGNTCCLGYVVARQRKPHHFFQEEAFQVTDRWHRLVEPMCKGPRVHPSDNHPCDSTNDPLLREVPEMLPPNLNDATSSP